MCIRDRDYDRGVDVRQPRAGHDYPRSTGEFQSLSLIHISEPTRLLSTSYAVFCLIKNNKIPGKFTFFGIYFFFLIIRRPPRSTLSSSSAASDVYKRQGRPRLPEVDRGVPI